MYKKEHLVNMIQGTSVSSFRSKREKDKFISLLKCTNFQKAHNSIQWTKIFHHKERFEPIFTSDVQEE